MAGEEWKCHTCGLWFRSWNKREDHLWKYQHVAPQFECECCDRFFPTLQQVEVHMDSWDHWGDYEFTCDDCDRDFGSFNAREQHMEALGHTTDYDNECDTCGVVFLNKQIWKKHMDSWDHRVEVEEIDSNELKYKVDYWCSLCTRYFESEEDRVKHEAQAHFYCHDCNRYFQNANNAWMHQNSKLHRGTPIRCPFCREYYSAATALCHHLERGACPKMPDLTRKQIFQLVRSKDPDGIISKQNIDLVPTITSGHLANEYAWNGTAYECYLCHRSFRNTSSLNDHFKASHQQALYHCPNKNCRKNFNTLAAVINHLESESCGFTRFMNVQRSATNILSGDRQISFN
ncbi:hypothetical protein PG997_007821 [Apiospora hydei]|uniref:C2H2-type domain-containing protein n=1 Tax=Apiospora hydei TaxID=1337664 RepID=A0ABR1W944_9PEZI